jgi:hypothetical protein
MSKLILSSKFLLFLLSISLVLMLKTMPCRTKTLEFHFTFFFIAKHDDYINLCKSMVEETRPTRAINFSLMLRNLIFCTLQVPPLLFYKCMRGETNCNSFKLAWKINENIIFNGVSIPICIFDFPFLFSAVNRVQEIRLWDGRGHDKWGCLIQIDFCFALHFQFLERNSLKAGFTFWSADRICFGELCVLVWENRHGGSVCVNHGHRYCTFLEARSNCNIERDKQVSSVFYLQLIRKFNNKLTI